MTTEPAEPPLTDEELDELLHTLKAGEPPAPTRAELDASFRAAWTLAMTQPGFTCIHCGAISHNQHDIDNRYCGGCHHFCDDVDSEEFRELSALRTTAIHPKCICVWKVADDRIGYERTRHDLTCPVHRDWVLCPKGCGMQIRADSLPDTRHRCAR